MGLRFRRSIKIAPGVKLNLNKKSVGVTVGTRGAHYTINSKGKKTASVGIPGTGLSYTTTSGGGAGKSSSRAGRNTQANTPNDSNEGNRQKWYQKTGWIIALLFLFFPVGLFLMWKYTKWNKYVKIGISVFWIIALFTPSSEELKKITLTADTSRYYDINEEILVEYSTDSTDYTLTESDFHLSGGKLRISDEYITFSAAQPGSYTVCAEVYDVKSNELIFNIEDKTAVAKAKAEKEARKEAEAQAQKESEEKARQEAEEAKRQEEENKKQAEQIAQLESATQQDSASTIQQPVESTPPAATNETIVYITNSGTKYHRETCRHLKDSKIEIKLSDAVKKHSPCGVCHPPTQ